MKNRIRNILCEISDSDLENQTNTLVREIETDFPVELYLYYRKSTDSLHLSSIIIEKEFRGKGVGSQIMQRICDFADVHDLIIAATPSSDLGGNKAKVVKFNLKFGFQHNRKGRKNFKFTETMIRYPNR